MKYEGNLYGKIGRKYVQLIDTTKDIEAKDARIAEFEAELTAEREKVERLREALIVSATVLHDLRDDWRVVAGAESIQWIRANNAETVARKAIAATAPDATK